ncbi:MAG: hypothetical protein K8R54_15765 [Bacteroidales bacterium]|nr:hypothetical protein [Bacteroidales bacterium]
MKNYKILIERFIKNDLSICELYDFFRLTTENEEFYKILSSYEEMNKDVFEYYPELKIFTDDKLYRLFHLYQTKELKGEDKKEFDKQLITNGAFSKLIYNFNKQYYEEGKYEPIPETVTEKPSKTKAVQQENIRDQTENISGNGRTISINHNRLIIMRIAAGFLLLLSGFLGYSVLEQTQEFDKYEDIVDSLTARNYTLKIEKQRLKKSSIKSDEISEQLTLVNKNLKNELKKVKENNNNNIQQLHFQNTIFFNCLIKTIINILPVSIKQYAESSDRNGENNEISLISPELKNSDNYFFKKRNEKMKFELSKFDSNKEIQIKFYSDTGTILINEDFQSKKYELSFRDQKLTENEIVYWIIKQNNDFKLGQGVIIIID